MIIKDLSKNYKCLFDLLSDEQVKYVDFGDYRKDIIQFLIDEKYLTLINGDILYFDNLEKIFILKNLFENEVGSYWHYSLKFRKIVDEMVSQNMLYFTNSLFTKPEQDYFNYYLNKSEFTNGLDLRNKYLHGTQASTDKEDEHKNSYFILLKLLILVICKIEDDLNINEFVSRRNQNS